MTRFVSRVPFESLSFDTKCITNRNASQTPWRLLGVRQTFADLPLTAVRNRAYTGQSRPSATGFNRQRSVSLRVAAISIARVRGYLVLVA